MLGAGPKLDSKKVGDMEIAMAGAIVVAVVAVIVQKRQQARNRRK
ncbi:hypothetical protein ART_4075 [Arthrobacter sp. PAMC 25486]|nr:hypothetical protein ART_4075 [Arthrobacter sp. PAMC 25486]